MSEKTFASAIFMVIFLAALTAFGPFVTDFYLPAMPAQAKDLNASTALTQAGLSASMWGLAIGQLIVGPLSDRKGRKVPLLCSLAVFCAATVACVFSPTMEFFVIASFVQGLGGAGGIVLAKSIATDLYSGRDLAKFLSIIGAVQGLAPVLAPLCGALVNEYLNWRDIFVVLLVIGLVLLISTLFFKETLKSYRPNTAKFPFFSLFALLKNDKTFVLLLVQQCAGFGLLFAYISASPFIYQELFGLSPLTYSVVFGCNAIVITIGTFVCQRFKSALISLKFGSIGMLLGASLIAASLYWQASVWILEASIAFSLLNLGLTIPSGTSLALDRQRERAGSAAALLGALGFVAGGIVAPLSGLGTAGAGFAAVTVISTAIGIFAAFYAARSLSFEEQTVTGD